MKAKRLIGRILKVAAAGLCLCSSICYAELKTGDSVAFGSYPQKDAKEKENVIWQVLSVEDDKVLLISEYVLDCQPYNKFLADSRWSSSFLRGWLNETFLGECFDAHEAEKIIGTQLKGETNSNYGTTNGDDTLDRIFVLSESDILEYFPVEHSAAAKPTEYARMKGAYYFDYCYNEKNLYRFNGNTTWWLRTPGASGTFGERINIFGAVFAGDEDPVFSHNVGVRPAMWVKKEAVENSLAVQSPAVVDLIAPPEESRVETGLPANLAVVASKNKPLAVVHNSSVNVKMLDTSDTPFDASVLPSVVNAGDEIKFGSYYQKNSRVKTPVVWKVLAVEDGKALLISKKALDCQDYNRWEFISGWAMSTIRDWLNFEFASAAFSKAELARIEWTHVINSDIADPTASGENTDDRIFLLSLNQAKNYFKTDAERICAPTMYARERMASFVRDYYTDGRRYENNGYWLLRSPDSGRERADYVDYTGALNDGVFTESLFYADINIAIRPAMWVNLKENARAPEDLVPSFDPDSEVKPLSCDVKVSDRVSFGQYYISSADKKEPLTWRVLDVYDGKALMVTDYGVDNHFYNDTDGEVTFETSSIRRFLNEEFYKDAFDAKQQEAVVLTEVVNDPNVEFGNNTDAGANTQDHVFLLSIDEARMYFPDSLSRRIKVTPYCKGLMSDSPAVNYGWWLRSPGEDQSVAAGVVFDGYVRFSGHKTNYFANTYVVRPAIMVDLSKLKQEETLKEDPSAKTADSPSD